MLHFGVAFFLLLALLSGQADAYAGRCAAVRMMVERLDGATGKATSTRRILQRNSNSRIAVASKSEDKVPVVSETTTFDTVSDLNQLSLTEFRCHSLERDAPPNVDPFALVADQIATLNDDVCEQLGANDEVLTSSAQHFFGAGNTREGKRVRPVLVRLMGRATAQAAGLDDEQQQAAAAQHSRLAAITEMIHTASLVHDDVLDAADTRRGGSAVHKLYSTKAAVLSGDFLLARASVALARLEMPSVTQEMAKSLEALVQGEIMQLQSTADERLSLECAFTALAHSPPLHLLLTYRPWWPLPSFMHAFMHAIAHHFGDGWHGR